MFSSIPKHWKGPLWMVWSCLLFVIIWGLIRVASEDLHPFVIVFFRTLFAVLAFAPFLLRHGWAPLKTKNIKLHALRHELHRVVCGQDQPRRLASLLARNFPQDNMIFP